MLVYRYRNTFLQNLHPLTGVLLILLYVAAILIINNPLYLVIIMISIILLAAADGCFFDVIRYGKIMIPFAVLLIVLNPILIHSGKTVIFTSSFKIPVMGHLKITLEAILYGIFSGLRIVCITLIFGFGNLILHPDRTFGFFSKFMKKSALLMSMTIRLFPTIMNSYNNIIEIEKLRGNNSKEDSFGKKIKNYGNIVNILFMSCLEDSCDMAESMYSRGYGIGSRSTYFKESFSKYDIIFIIICLGTFVYLRYFQMSGFNNMQFYPLVTNPISNISLIGIILCSVFFVPAIINWGWNIWK